MLAPEDAFHPCPDGADAPVAGFYSYDRRGKVGLPVRIWFGPPLDLDDVTSTLERPWRWQMMVGDRLVDERTREKEWDVAWDDVWPVCADSKIDRSEYEYRLERIAFAKTDGAASDPWARRTGKIDLLTAPIPE